jgi:hypothetical protein
MNKPARYFRPRTLWQHVTYWPALIGTLTLLYFGCKWFAYFLVQPAVTPYTAAFGQWMDGTFGALLADGLMALVGWCLVIWFLIAVHRQNRRERSLRAAAEASPGAASRVARTAEH